MKKRWMVMVLLGLIIASACQSNSLSTLDEPVPDQKQPSSADGLSIVLEQTEYPEAPDTMQVTLKNVSEDTYEYGEFFQLEQNLDGKWYIVQYSDAVFYQNPRFTNMGVHLQPGDTVTQIYSPETLDLQLPEGTYRLVKTFTHSDPTYTVSIAAPFRVH
ncbi:hypothetical protein HUG15_14745 [Salicibibacter cibarius]|uniref:Bacterial Ig-like domain-containing protein n=1 Tax=Salicibibacter cibarius TaxID=2743000 RepID=A0A7T7CC92_9BACI|nr:immunoglobulin-like domain-containing protein [Salicibibacter cibarius]QQK76698.1 hypothetical protein HUG15_14745 [Salicibibacter cibarius]